MNAEFCYKVIGKRQWPSFSRWSNRLTVGESFAIEFDAVHDDGCIDVIVRFTGANVGKLAGDRHGLARVGLGRVERKTSVVECRGEVYTTVGDEGVAEQDIEVAIAIDVGNGRGGPHSVGHAQGGGPCVVDVSRGAGVAVKRPEPSSKTDEDFRGPLSVDVKPERR